MSLTQNDIYQALDELRAIATLGLNYATNSYDRDRYRRILNIQHRLLTKLENQPFRLLQYEYQQDNWLHISPAAGAEAAVFRDGQLLLIQRSDNGLWAVPGGLVEVGETLAQAARRELAEETGLQGEVKTLLGIFDSRLWHSQTKAQLYHAIFLVNVSTLRIEFVYNRQGLQTEREGF